MVASIFFFPHLSSNLSKGSKKIKNSGGTVFPRVARYLSYDPHLLRCKETASIGTPKSTWKVCWTRCASTKFSEVQIEAFWLLGFTLLALTYACKSGDGGGLGGRVWECQLGYQAWLAGKKLLIQGIANQEPKQYKMLIGRGVSDQKPSKNCGGKSWFW